jgi:putative endonuclease
MRNYTVYLLTNYSRKILYCGVTNHIERRLHEHQNKKVGFTGKYKAFYLVWYETFQDPLEAIRAEKRIKKMRRKEKDELIASRNPFWEFYHL